MATEVLEVWSGDSHAGNLRVVSMPGRAREMLEFEYRESWLSFGFALSPELPLDRAVRRPTLGRDLFGAFEDSAPDRWGQQVLQERARREGIRPGDFTPVRRLLKVADRTRQGALRFRNSDGFLASDFGAAPWSSIADLYEAAMAFVEDPATATELLLHTGTSPGGAQPKTVVEDDAGALWLLKFPQTHSSMDQGRWEQATMLASQAAGITVAESNIITIDQWRAMFITRRFDREEDGARVPFVSFHTMLQRTDTATDQPISYVQLARELRRWSGNPKADGREFFRRAAFNASIENNDDHMRNFGLVRKDGGWRLSPAFDVNPAPTVNASTALVDWNFDRYRNPYELLPFAKDFELSPHDAEEELERVLAAAAGLIHHAAELGVDSEDLNGAKWQRWQERIEQLARLR